MNQREGFILLESLVSLAILSLLVVSVMGMIQTLSKTYTDTGSPELSAMTVELTYNPQKHLSHPRISLIRSRTLDHGKWNHYRYQGKDGTHEISIFIPPAPSANSSTRRP